MTKSEAKEFLLLNPIAKAVHLNNGHKLTISVDNYEHSGVLIYQRKWLMPVDQWLDNSFFGNPMIGWSIELPS